MKRRERLSGGKELDLSVESPYRPEGKAKKSIRLIKVIIRRETSSHLLPDEQIENIESTKIILTPVMASRSQKRKHKCDMILSPVRKSTRLMKNNKQDIVGDKLISTTYAYANNKCIIDKKIDA